jgi:WD40 repeat protein
MRRLTFERDVQGVAFHPSSGLLAADLGEWISFHDLAARVDRLRVAPALGMQQLRSPLAFSPNGRLLLRDGDLLELSEVWQQLHAPVPAAGLVVLSRSGGPFPLGSCAALSRDGRFAAAFGYDHFSRSAGLEVWEVTVRRRLWRERTLRDWCHGLALAPDGRLLATLTEPAVPLLDGGTGQVVARLEHAQQPHLAAFSPDGRLLATATGASRRVWLWDVDSRRCVTKLRAFRQAPTALAFHPEGRLLAAASTDGLIRLWDTAGFKELAALDWKIGPIRALAFAPDGMTAAAAGVTKTVVVWDVDDLAG